MASDAPAAAIPEVSANHVVGCVRRYNKKLGWGFVTVISDGAYQGQDIFVHQSSIAKSGNTNFNRYPMLFIGECVEFDIAPSGKEEHPNQAINVKGFKENRLMYDNSSIIFRTPRPQGEGFGQRDGGDRAERHVRSDRTPRSERPTRGQRGPRSERTNAE